MISVNIKVSVIDDVKNIVSAATQTPCDIDLVSGRYIIDAKSIMGIFSLDFSKPIKVEIHGTQDEAAEFLEKIKQYIVTE